MKKIYKILAAAAVTLLLLYLLIKQINLKDISDLLLTAKVDYLLIAFVAYMFAYLFRALRFKFLLKEKQGIFKMFNIMCIHNLFNYLLPVRTGELSYVYLMKQSGVKGTKALASLVIVRVFDFLTVILLFTIGLLFINDVPSYMSDYLNYMLILLLITLLAIVSFILMHNKILQKLKRLSVKTKKKTNYVISRLYEIVESLNMLDYERTLTTSILSILIWVSLYLFNFTVLKAIGIEFDFWFVVIGSTIPVFVTILPVYSVAGFGTIEAGWALGFLALGVTKDIAISTAFAVHIFQVICFSVAGVFGLLVFHRLYNQAIPLKRNKNI